MSSEATNANNDSCSYEYAIEVNGLSKCYQIYEKPSDRLKQMLMRGHKQYYKEFWALKDVSFKIKKGEAVGIIGRNGSGKSTLLQMICGTLNPTAGEVKVGGRVAALLELGAGFNPEFSGIENVYMAASLYGLSKEEIDQRFDSIAAFADIGDHIQQPVKTYSSGMFVRLAFAVIAHVNADILVVDEALAVGDAVFTEKCMRFIRKFRKKGTLLFVSHDMSSVLNLCEQVIWLHAGQIRQLGPAKEMSEIYLQYTKQEVYGDEIRLHTIDKKEAENCYMAMPTRRSDVIDYGSLMSVKNNLSEANGWKSGGGEIVAVEMYAVDANRVINKSLKGGERVKMLIEAVANQPMEKPLLGFLVRDRLGQDLFGENTLSFTDKNPILIRAGERIRAEFTFRLPMLPNGYYSVATALADGDLHNHLQHHWLHNSLMLHVVSSKVRFGLVGVDFEQIDVQKK